MVADQIYRTLVRSATRAGFGSRWWPVRCEQSYAGVLGESSEHELRSHPVHLIVLCRRAERLQQGGQLNRQLPRGSVYW